MANTAEDLRELTEAELEKRLRELRQGSLESRLQQQTGQLEKTHMLKEHRRDIARVQTILAEKRTATPA